MSIHNRSQYMAICWLTGSGLTRLLAQDWPGHMVSFLLCILGKVLIHCHWQTNSSPKGLPVTASRSNEPNWTALPNLPYSTTITAHLTFINVWLTRINGTFNPSWLYRTELDLVTFWKCLFQILKKKNLHCYTVNQRKQFNLLHTSNKCKTEKDKQILRQTSSMCDQYQNIKCLIKYNTVMMTADHLDSKQHNLYVKQYRWDS